MTSGAGAEELSAGLARNCAHTLGKSRRIDNIRTEPATVAAFTRLMLLLLDAAINDAPPSRAVYLMCSMTSEIVSKSNCRKPDGSVSCQVLMTPEGSNGR